MSNKKSEKITAKDSTVHTKKSTPKPVKPYKITNQERLLRELVNQNKIVISLLSEIKDSLVKPHVEPVLEYKEQEISSSDQTEKSTPEIVPTVKKTTEKRRKLRAQFVMRFDDKEPLNLDIIEPVVKAVETQVQQVKSVIEKESEEMILIADDENNYGEKNPFLLDDDQ